MVNPASDPTTRFSIRVDDYRKFRPGYPPECAELIRSTCRLTGDSVIADVGSGTGLMTQLLLPHCRRMYAVEPNDPMRGAAEEILGGEPGFVSVKGTAEETTLGDASVDLVVSAQAFHWFDRDRAKKEFKRILRGERRVALIWNNRLDSADEFHRDMEKLFLDRLPEYHRVKHRDVPLPEIAEFYSPANVTRHIVPNQQEFDLSGFEGRILSASYVPPRGDPRYEPFIKLVRELFRRHQRGGKVTMRYATAIYQGKFPLP